MIIQRNYRKAKMKKFFKQLFCDHAISIKTESWSPEHIFIVKTVIQCSKCEKTFPRHYEELCCHVQHIQHEIMRDYWLEKVKKVQQ